VRVKPVPVVSNSPGTLRLASAPPVGTTILLAASYRSDWRLGDARGVPFASGAGTAFRARGSGSVIELNATRWNRYAYELGFGGVLLVLLACALVQQPRRRARRSGGDLSGLTAVERL
jgi:hypothetical protein